MNFLLHVWFFSIPLFAVGFEAGPRFVSLSYVAAGFVSAGAIAARSIISSLFSIPYCRREGWLLLAFIAIALTGVAVSPFPADQLLGRAAIQIFGIAVVATAAAIACTYIATSPRADRLLGHYLLFISLLAVMALVQFSINNTVRDQLVQFSFLNFLGAEMWRTPGEIGPVFRAASAAIEPAHFARFIAPMIGAALLRTNLLASPHSIGISSFVPQWAAIAVLISAVATFSGLAIMLTLTIAIATLYLIGQLRLKTIMAALLLGSLLVVAIGFISSASFEEFALKFASLSLIASNPEEIGNVDSEAISALAILSNRAVAEASFSAHPLLGSGIGSHSLSYDELMPAHLSRLMSSMGLYGLNSEDAAGLFLKLLSEMGLSGVLAYLAIFVYPTVVAIKSIKKAKKLPGADTSPMLALLVAMTASLVGLLVIALARYGAYFEPTLWLQAGIVIGLSHRVNGLIPR